MFKQQPLWGLRLQPVSLSIVEHLLSDQLLRPLRRLNSLVGGLLFMRSNLVQFLRQRPPQFMLQQFGLRLPTRH